MSRTEHNPMAISSYPRLLKNGGFQSFLWTQFLGAFNDNVFKMIVQMKAIELGAQSGSWLALAGAVFVLPFLLFAGWSGQVADRFSKTKVLFPHQCTHTVADPDRLNSQLCSRFAN